MDTSIHDYIHADNCTCMHAYIRARLCLFVPPTTTTTMHALARFLRLVLVCLDIILLTNNIRVSSMALIIEIADKFCSSNFYMHIKLVIRECTYLFFWFLFVRKRFCFCSLSFCLFLFSLYPKKPLFLLLFWFWLWLSLFLVVCTE